MRRLEARLLVWRSAQTLGSSPSSPGAHLGLDSQFRGPEGAESERERTLNPFNIANYPAVIPTPVLKEGSLPRSLTIWSS